MDITGLNKERLAAELSDAYHALNSRGLLRAATWAADMLAGLDLPEEPSFVPPQTPLLPRVMQAKAYFDMKEFNRCWNALGGQSSSSRRRASNAHTEFLRLFSRYHAGEAVKENETSTEIFVDRSKQQNDTKMPENPYLGELQLELEQLPPAMLSSDSYLQYLYGVVLRARGDVQSALKQLKLSFLTNPFNWSCALELKFCFTKLVDLGTELTGLQRAFSTKPLEHQLMFLMFYCFVNDDFDPVTTVEIIKTKLLPVFPRMLALITQLARLYSAEYHYDLAAGLFERALKADPFRLEDLDAYSNLLYVQDERAKLAYLAQYVSGIDKYRAESCCVVANYYSLRGEHELAVEYYTRAIVLNRNYTSTWTLMGHEFIELGNPHAAIETYRQAVDLVPFDYRPLFGLGQAYEVLAMHYFAQYYFQRALALRPGDVRLWDALGNCYEELDRRQQALTAFTQAFKIAEANFYYAYRMARLNESLDNMEEAVRLMTLCAEARDGDETAQNESTQPEWPARARLWLAQQSLAEKNYADALAWARRVQHGTREMLEEARAIEASARAQTLRYNYHS